MSAARRSRRRSHWLPALTGAAAGILLALVGAPTSCAPRERAAAHAPRARRAAPVASGSAAAPATARAPASNASSSDVDAGARVPRADAPRPGVALRSVPPLATGAVASNADSNAALTQLGRREVWLLGDIERELHRDPPPEAHALLDEQRRGADRAALIDYVQRHFPRDLPLRVVALRWIDRVRPATAGTPARAPHSTGARTPAPWVAPLGTKPP